MRILMLSQFYPPIIGGEEQAVQTLSTELVSRGHEVAVATLWQQGLAEFELDHGVRVYRIRSSMQRMPFLFSHSGRPYAPPFPDPDAMLALRRIITRERPEIVHAHNWLVYSFLPLKAWSGARLIVTLHNYNLVCVKTTLMYRKALCDGPGMKKCLGCAMKHYGFAKGIPIVLSNQLMGQIERGAVEMFLTVSRAVAVDNGLVGSGLPFQVIPNFMPDDAMSVDCPENVFVLNDWPRYAVMEAWRRSMIALAPSVGPETFGIAVMEAMSLGCPVIASRIGGLIDLVADGETGLLVQPGDSSALRQAIERLLSHPNLRSRMGKAGLGKVSEFRASKVVPRIEQIYEQVVL